MIPTLEQILDTTLEVLGIERSAFEKSKRTRSAFAVKVRQIVCYVGQEYGHTQCGIGDFLGLDHSTVHHNKETAKDYATFENDYANVIEQVLLKLGEVKSIRKVAKVMGFVVRDEDGSMFFCEGGKPVRSEEEKIWLVEDGMAYSIASEYFPQVTWDDEPIECQITLRLK